MENIRQERKIQPLRAYEILTQHLTKQDNLIQQKVLGLLIGNSILLTAFFMSMSNDGFDKFRCFLAAIALCVCSGFAVSLVFDIKAKWESVKGLEEIEKAHYFAFLKRIQSRPIADIERRARGPLKRRQSGDVFWPMLPVVFVAIWVFALIAR